MLPDSRGGELAFCAARFMITPEGAPSKTGAVFEKTLEQGDHRSTVSNRSNNVSIRLTAPCPKKIVIASSCHSTVDGILGLPSSSDEIATMQMRIRVCHVHHR